jgi:hypothetical protein
MFRETWRIVWHSAAWGGLLGAVYGAVSNGTDIIVSLVTGFFRVNAGLQEWQLVLGTTILGGIVAAVVALVVGAALGLVTAGLVHVLHRTRLGTGTSGRGGVVLLAVVLLPAYGLLRVGGTAIFVNSVTMPTLLAPAALVAALVQVRVSRLPLPGWLGFVRTRWIFGVTFVLGLVTAVALGLYFGLRFR